MTAYGMDTNESGNVGQDQSAEAFWAHIDRERSLHPPIEPPASFFEPLSAESLAELGKAIAKHEALVDWFTPYLAERRAARGPARGDG
jgi:hypothetical protein